jgi:hypothetical protein
MKGDGLVNGKRLEVTVTVEYLRIGMQVRRSHYYYLVNTIIDIVDDLAVTNNIAMTRRSLHEGC